MREELMLYPRSMAVRANMSVLRFASGKAAGYGVLMFAQGNRLKSLSLRAVGFERKLAIVEKNYVVLGVFLARPGETRADAYRRLFDEAAALGCLPLGEPEM